MSDEGYECPECGADVEPEMMSCPECGVEFESGTDENAGRATDSRDGDEVGSDGARTEKRAVSERPRHGKDLSPGPSPAGERQSGKVRFMSRWGLAASILSVVALAATLIILHWDTWVTGAAEDSIGSRQLLVALSCFGAFTAFMIITLVDLLRTKTVTGA